MTWKSNLEQYTGKVVDGDIGRKIGYNRIAVHHFVLPPGSRTSLPHAESAEEEFVFVLKGSPDLWLNGYIHRLSEGFAVGFPAGTGIAHTVINNTDSDVSLLVAGEKTKKENLCAFPINPENKKESPIWWEDYPKHELGPHRGLPGNVLSSEIAKENSPYIYDCYNGEKGRLFHYPGDNETFGSGVRITNKVGLKSLGIWFETLPAGRRSAFPHAHTHEEEFIFVLDGSPTVWLDGYTKQLQKDEFAAFPSGTGISHTLINDTNETVKYICIGETQDFPDEKIVYPLNPFRQIECKRKGWYWIDWPSRNLGPDSGLPTKKFPNHLQLAACFETDAEQVLRLFQKSPSYFEKVEGCLANLKMAKHAIVDMPKDRREKYFKEFLFIKKNDQILGVVDLHINHPEEKICYIGLLLLDQSLVGQGLGKECYRFIEDYILRALQCDKVRLGIAEVNQVDGFWEKMGFKSNGHSYDFQTELKNVHVKEFEKKLKE